MWEKFGAKRILLNTINECEPQFHSLVGRRLGPFPLQGDLGEYSCSYLYGPNATEAKGNTFLTTPEAVSSVSGSRLDSPATVRMVRAPCQWAKY